MGQRVRIKARKTTVTSAERTGIVPCMVYMGRGFADAAQVNNASSMHEHVQYIA